MILCVLVYLLGGVRKYLVENNYVDCIIQLPGNLFFGTSIATCIMVMKKNKTDNDVLFIDATKECIKVTNNNKLTEENIDRIVSVFTKREEVKHLAYVAACEEIAENDYNLSGRNSQDNCNYRKYK